MYGEIVWYDIFEAAAGPWLAEAERVTASQAAEAAAVEARAGALRAAAEAGGLV